MIDQMHWECNGFFDQLLTDTLIHFGRKLHLLICGARPRRRYDLNFAMDNPPEQE